MTRRKMIALIILLGLSSYELAVFTILGFYPYLPDPGLVALNTAIFLRLAPISTILLLGLLYAWLVRAGTKELRNRSDRFDSFVRLVEEPLQKTRIAFKNASLSDFSSTFVILSRPVTMLGTSMIVNTLLVFMRYRPDLNSSGTLVGIDSPSYVNWIDMMLAHPLPQALQYSFVVGLDGSRPLLLLLLYPIALAGASPSLLIEYLPTVLAPLLSLSTYLFVRYGQGSARFAGLTSLFTPISFYTTVGLWGGYYANWLGLVLAYLFLAMLLVFSTAPSRLNYALLYTLSLALFLTHPWTWILITTVGFLFAISLWRETRRLAPLKSTLPIILTGIVVDTIKSWTFATESVGVDVAGKFQSAGLGQLGNYWMNVVQALLYTHGGLIGNWLLLGMSALAAFALRFSNPFERLLVLWTLVSSIPFALLDSYHQARIVYDLPVPVLLSVAVVYFVPHAGAGKVPWPQLVIVLLLLIIANYALQGILLI